MLFLLEVDHEPPFYSILALVNLYYSSTQFVFMFYKIIKFTFLHL